MQAIVPLVPFGTPIDKQSGPPAYCVLRTPHSLLLFSVVCLAPLAAARAESPVAQPVDGAAFRAELSAADAKWQLTFTADGKTRVLPAADLVQWGVCGEPRRGPVVVLADGGLLVADVAGADKETLTADSDVFSALKLPLDTLAGVVFHLPGARQDRDLLMDRVARAAGESDRLVLDNGDELAGLVEAIEDDAVTLRAEVGPVKVETQRIVALIFNPALRQKPKPPTLQAWAGFADGTRLLASQLAIDESALKVVTLGGRAWSGPAKKLVWLQPLGGRAVYLSDMKPEGYRHVPFLDLTWPFHADRNATGGLLRCGGRLCLKGVGVHSASRLSYALDKPYRRFEAELGIDDSARGGGSVRFRVFVDGREKLASETVRGGAAAAPVSVDVTGAKRLDLVVDYADRADVLDHADWLSARLVK